jgi:hypothetical protein
MVLIEALAEGVFHEVGERAIRRMSAWEEKVHIHRAFRASEHQNQQDGNSSADE